MVNRPLVLFGVLALLALALGLALPQAFALSTLEQGAYWYCWALLLLAGWTLWRWLRESLPRPLPWRTYIPELLAGALCLLALHVQEPKTFKTFMDEPVQLGQSMQLHRERLANVPERGVYVDGELTIVQTRQDKRASFYPFLISLLHDLTGYRIANGYAVNVMLSVTAAALALLLGNLVAGRVGGIALLLLLIGVPEFIRAGSGAGFEMLNLAALLLFAVATIQHCRSPRRTTQDLLCLSVLLLAQARYESILFAGFAGLAILYGWWQQQKPHFSPVLWATPLLLVPYLWLYRLFQADSSYWQMFSKEVSNPFGFSFIPDNLVHALAYFTSAGESGSTYANHWPLFALGLLAMLGLLYGLLKRLARKQWPDASDTGLLIIFGGFGALFLLMMCYFWGDFEDPITSRLALPFFIPLALAVARLLGAIHSPRWHRGAVVLIMLIFIGYSLPKVTRHSYSNKYRPSTEQNHITRSIDYLHEQGIEQFIVVTTLPHAWLVNGIAATRTGLVNRRLPMMAWALQNDPMPPIYYYERIRYNPLKQAGETIPLESSLVQVPQLDERLEREVVLESYDHNDNGFRLSRLTGTAVEPVPIEIQTRDEFLTSLYLFMP